MKMITCCLSIFYLATLLPALPLEAQAPSTLKDAEGRLMWISAEAAADEEKIVDLDLIGDHLRSTMEKQRQVLGDQLLREETRSGKKPLVATIPDAECKSRTMTVDDRGGIGGDDTLGELIAYSKTIIRGTIRTVDVGFAFDAPISLLGIEASEVLKGAGPKSLFYIDYPVARFRIGPFSFCNLNKGFEPRPGDEILLFAYSDAVGPNEALYLPRLDQMLFQGQDGTLFVPASLRETPQVKVARTLDDLTVLVRSFLTVLKSQGAGQ